MVSRQRRRGQGRFVSDLCRMQDSGSSLWSKEGYASEWRMARPEKRMTVAEIEAVVVAMGVETNSEPAVT